MHPNVRRALEEIDAAVMNGDAFIDPSEVEAWATMATVETLRANRRDLFEYLERWRRELGGAV